MNYSNYNQTISNVSSQQGILRNTYTLLALSLIPTAIGALIGSNMSFMFMAGSPILSTLLMLGAVYFLMFMVERNKYSFAGVVWMMVFTFAMGVLLGPLLQVALRIGNGGSLITLAALLTSAVFFVMAFIASVVKKPLNGIGNFLTIGVIVLFIAVIANIFLRLPMLQLAICGAFVIFSSLMILWQLNRIIVGGETNYISATLTLYIAIYNLFTSLLQILMAFSGNNRR